MALTASQQAAINAAVQEEDYTKTEAGGFKRTMIPVGKCFVRLREYVELGNQMPPEWKQKAYNKTKPVPQARWVFEIVAAVRVYPEDHEKAGERYNAAVRTVKPEGGEEFQVVETIAVTTDIGKNAKSGHIKLFKALNAACGNLYTHPAQLLEAEGFIAQIVHYWGKDDKDADGNPLPGKDPSGMQLRNDQGWTFSAPRVEDPETGETKKINVPPLLGGTPSIKCFLWNFPDEESWNSLYIDGERDEMKDGKATGKKISKNWLQERILKATNYAGSPLSTILEGGAALNDIADAGVMTPDAAGDVDPLADLG